MTMRKVIKLTIFFSLLGSLGLASCGVRGPLEAPPSSKKSEIGAGTPEAKSESKEHEGFVLDRLLR